MKCEFSLHRGLVSGNISPCRAGGRVKTRPEPAAGTLRTGYREETEYSGDTIYKVSAVMYFSRSVV